MLPGHVIVRCGSDGEDLRAGVSRRRARGVGPGGRFGDTRNCSGYYRPVRGKDRDVQLVVNEMSRGKEAREAKPVLGRSRDIRSGLRLNDETTAPTAREIIAVQHPDGNAERDIDSEEQYPELLSGRIPHG